MCEQEHVIIANFQHGVEELAGDLRKAREECSALESEWRFLEEERAKLIQTEQQLTSLCDEHKSTLDTLTTDEAYLCEVLRDAEADFAHKEARLQELHCLIEDESNILQSLGRKLCQLKEQKKCLGEPAHYQYLLKEAECDVQKKRSEVESLNGQMKRIKTEVAHARALVNESHHQLAANNAQAYENGITVADLAEPHHVGTIAMPPACPPPRPHTVMLAPKSRKSNHATIHGFGPC